MEYLQLSYISFCIYCIPVLIINKEEIINKDERFVLSYVFRVYFSFTYSSYLFAFFLVTTHYQHTLGTRRLTSGYSLTFSKVLESFFSQRSTFFTQRSEKNYGFTHRLEKNYGFAGCFQPLSAMVPLLLGEIH